MIQREERVNQSKKFEVLTKRLGKPVRREHCVERHGGGVWGTRGGTCRDESSRGADVFMPASLSLFLPLCPLFLYTHSLKEEPEPCHQIVCVCVCVCVCVYLWIVQQKGDGPQYGGGGGLHSCP